MIQAETDSGQREKKAAILAWVLVGAWAVVIFAMSAKTGHQFETGDGLVAQVRQWLADALSGLLGYPVDVSPIGHFTEYLVFGALLANALRHHVATGKAALGAIGITALYAVTDEFHQLFVPGRSCDPADWLVDVCAASLAALVGWLLLRAKR